MNSKESILAKLCFWNARTAYTNKQYDLAEGWCQDVLELFPDHAETHDLLMYILSFQRKYKEALTHADVSVEKGPRPLLARYSRGLIKLYMDDYVGGFEDLEARLDLPHNLALGVNNRWPIWKGEDCESLHVFGEQGFGDIFMFARFLPLIKNVKKIYYQVPGACSALIAYNFRNYPNIEIICDTEGQDFDYTVHVVTLAKLLGCTVEGIPQFKLEAEPEYIEKWKEYKGFIGMCLQGRRGVDEQCKEWNARREVPQDEILKVLERKTLISLEKDVNPGIQSWSDVAGIIANCALIVSIDSGPVHLAAAMGAETVLLNHYQTCWRYGLVGKHTPWYSANLTILRQKLEGDWGPVMQELKELLDDKTRASRAPFS